ncbi:MAG: sigma-70 family RNA polymerase sigma factor [Polyangia bacterium]
MHTDEQLLAASRTGDRRALEQLLARYEPRVYRFGMRMCRDPQDASEVLQETLIAAARTIRDFRGGASLSTWMYTIARSFCIKRHRRSKFAPLDEASLDEARDLATSAPDPEASAASRQIERAMLRALATLDPAQREVLVLRDGEGLTAPEVAAVVGASVDAVKSRLHRARAAMRAALAPLIDARPADVVDASARSLEGDPTLTCRADARASLR